jgi:hypothetical protein
MIPLFLGLTIANLAALLGTMGLGYAAAGGAASASLRGWHMLAGALSAILCIAVHCIVFTYFIATAKWIQHAVSVKGLDAAYTLPTRSFRAQAFPAALAAIAAVFVAAMFGAAADTRLVSVGWHHAVVLGAFGVNLLSASLEYMAVSRNGKLIDRILAEIPPSEIEAEVR